MSERTSALPTTGPATAGSELGLVLKKNKQVVAPAAALSIPGRLGKITTDLVTQA